MDYTLIANSGIQVLTTTLKLNLQDKFRMCFHEWFDQLTSQWSIELVYKLTSEDGTIYYSQKKLYDEGYLAGVNPEINPIELKGEGINPIKVDDNMFPGTEGDVYEVCFNSQEFKSALSLLENQWIPVPYFVKRNATKFKFGPLNWSRMKLIPKSEEKGEKEYDVAIAFDTHTLYELDSHNECPVFDDNFSIEQEYALCKDCYSLMDFCSFGENHDYIHDGIFKLLNPGVLNLSQVRTRHKMAYIAHYQILLNYLANNAILPSVKLFRDKNVEYQSVDMVVDIGNSKTTALLIEGGNNFKTVPMLELIDFTKLVEKDGNGCKLCTYREPFDMRLAFRKVGFGSFGYKNSRQFIYPSLVRLGKEANDLVHQAKNTDDGREALSTCSSPKRYLWDWKESKEEWKFLVLPGEEDEHVLNVPGITEMLKPDGRISTTGGGGQSHHYSRRSLMTFAFLEMLVQAQIQINSVKHRSAEFFGNAKLPRKIKNIVVTCPTSMSKVEREALIKCAQDAVFLLQNFSTASDPTPIKVIPQILNHNDDEPNWYYDEATCSQLVYMFSEVGDKYKGNCDEFFELYGKQDHQTNSPSITVGSLDIGAGTSDLMICNYTYKRDITTVVTPNPMYYDSYYEAGDDILQAMVKNLMLLDEENSAFRRAFKSMTAMDYHQKIKNFFGPDYHGLSMAEKLIRRDFNIQYSVPLMTHFLSLLSSGVESCEVKYQDVFAENPMNQYVIDGFKNFFGLDVTQLIWNFKADVVSKVVRDRIEPLLKRIATIMYSYACDVIVLSGRPASLPVIREIFLKYNSVSPDRLVVLNNYYVGDWYPFTQNTGYVKNAKTIVAMGGMLAYYASEMSSLNKFTLDLSKLQSNLKSTVNYVDEGQGSNKYLITPDISQQEFCLTEVPTSLNVKQIDMDSYPSRPLYSIDYNRAKLADTIRRTAVLNNEDMPSDTEVLYSVQKKVEMLRKLMPYRLTIERDPEDKEKLTITSIIDRNNNSLSDTSLEIHIQSLGVHENYWLDSGIFEF